MCTDKYYTNRIPWIQQLGILLQARQGFAYCHGEMSHTLTWRDIYIIFQRTGYNCCLPCHTQSKHISAIFIYDMTPAHSAELSFRAWHKEDGQSCDNRLQPVKSKIAHLSCSHCITDAQMTDYIMCVVVTIFCKPARIQSSNIIPQNAFKCLNSLLCTVDELVLIGPLKACLHSFVVPQLLCVIKELLRKRKKHIRKTDKRQ